MATWCPMSPEPGFHSQDVIWKAPLQFFPVFFHVSSPCTGSDGGDPQPGMRGPPSSQKGQPTSTWLSQGLAPCVAPTFTHRATRLGPGPARGQAHIRVSCPHFPHWRSGDVVLLSHMATCYVSLLQPCKPPHPDIPSSQHQRASLLSATTSPPSTYRRKSALRLVHKPALNLGLRFQNLPPTPELPVTSSQLNRGGTLS